jgi:hypothetical protein
MLTGASLLWILFGWLSVSAVAADTGWHRTAFSPSSGPDSPGDPGRNCQWGWSGDRGAGHCCSTLPPRTPNATRTPTPEATTATPRPRPRNVAPAAPPADGSSPPAASASPGAASSPGPTDLLPPVLAPPVLTDPSIGALNSGRAGPSPVDVIALSAVLVASTVAAVSFVLIRRSV